LKVDLNIAAVDVAICIRNGRGQLRKERVLGHIHDSRLNALKSLAFGSVEGDAMAAADTETAPMARIVDTNARRSFILGRGWRKWK
jgi:hypothetical protein